MENTFMAEALRLAKIAYGNGDVPVGCVVVLNGEIVGRGYNKREKDTSVSAHAEIVAMEDACKSVNSWHLSDCELYVTLEPCPMCAGAIINSRIKKVYYGTKDEHMGACGSVINLFEEGFGHHPAVYGGIMKEECLELLQSFFKALRTKS